MAEVILSAVLPVLIEKAVFTASNALFSGKDLESHITQLTQSLEFIQAVIDDAEEKQLTDKSVNLWLNNLKDISYELDDLLDEIMIQDPRRIQQDETHMLRKFISRASKLSHRRIRFNRRVIKKIKDMNYKLEALAKLRNNYNLREYRGGAANQSTGTSETTSLVIESEVYGRKEEKETIIKLLRENNTSEDNPFVIPIIGMGGLGKTTLAQLVYNDVDVSQHFDVRGWVCVSDQFDLVSVTKKIYESVTSERIELTNLSALQESLKKKLVDRKFLIVLDDVWNEDYDEWYKLCLPLRFGALGSRIIVTARSQSVADKVSRHGFVHHMKILNDEDCADLLFKCAGKSFLHNTELRHVGMRLVEKCKGLPLAAKTLGGVLRSKETREEWEDILSSNIWNMTKENSILLVLRLSYRHLLPHLKPLFAFCSLFPKDYLFDKEKLIHLWMGEGFLEQQHKSSKTRVVLGLEYFKELFSRSFFQHSSDGDSKFMMHDLLHDLAQFVAGGTCCHLDGRMDNVQEYEIPKKSRHCSFYPRSYETFGKFKVFSQVKGLRTLLQLGENICYLSCKILTDLVPRLYRLRVLSLRRISNVTELPDSIFKLIHLRHLNLSETDIAAVSCSISKLVHLCYLDLSNTKLVTLPDSVGQLKDLCYLDLSWTEINTLPDSLGDLSHLVTLSLRGCRSLCKLPPTLGNLSNLRHFNNKDTSELKDMPIEIGQLKTLQELPLVVVAKGNFFGLKELRDLKLLHGSLTIVELQNVVDLEDVNAACLRSKDNLDELYLKWAIVVDDPKDVIPQEDVIESLQPHENLRRLFIELYGGLTFPSWIGICSYNKLSDVTITSWLECSCLPPLGQLPNLQRLSIEKMPKVKCIGQEFCGHYSVISFPKLEELNFHDMPEWEEWICGDAQTPFPHLRKLEMVNCCKLRKVSPMSCPTLLRLRIQVCNIILLESFSSPESLTVLEVHGISGLVHFPTEVMQSLVSLEVLECSGCHEMHSVFPEEINLPKLRKLKARGCPQLVSLGQGVYEQQLPCKLEILEIFDCENLVFLPNDMRNLREFTIRECDKLVSIPQNSVSPMLKLLSLADCSALDSLPDNMSGLENLEMSNCSSLRTWPTNNSPTALKTRLIQDCSEMEPVAESKFSDNSFIHLEVINLRNWRSSNSLLQCLPVFEHLVKLRLYKCDDVKRLPDQGFPPRLREVEISSCVSLESLPEMIGTMKSIVEIAISGCPSLQNFPISALPPNLSSLDVRNSKLLKPLSQWGLHGLPSLIDITIHGRGFEYLELLGDDDRPFPPSLNKLDIRNFTKLTSLAKVLENLDSLKVLVMRDCANLSVLPSKRILQHLEVLEIWGCSRLVKKFAKHKGDDWPKIEGIPCVCMGAQNIHNQCQMMKVAFSGILVTLTRVRVYFYWPLMKQEITNWVQCCETCVRSKPDFTSHAGLLQPLDIPPRQWSSISIDFIEGLPKSEGRNVIMVVVDRYTKYAHFISLSHPYSAEDIARSDCLR